MNRSFLFHLFVLCTLVTLTITALGAFPVYAEWEDGIPSVPKNENLDAPGTLELTFSDMQMVAPKLLTGPVSEYYLRFNLPVEWTPAGKVSLALELSAYFSSLLPGEDNSSISGLIGGNLTVTLNGFLLGVKTLQQSGDQVIQFEFDSSQLTIPTRGSVNELRIRWDGTSSCLMNLLSSVTVMPTSKMIFSYTENVGTLSLNDFPVPFFIENSLQPHPIILLLPASSTQSELRAALIIAAAIGQLSEGTSSFEMVPLEEYSPQNSGMQNVILVLSSNKLEAPEVQSLGLPARFQLGQGEGIIQLFNPSAGGYGLLVSGDETGIVKAAQVMSANLVIAPGDGETMVVSAVNPSSAPAEKEDMTLQDLGVGEILLTQQEGLVRSFDFFIPVGRQVRPDSTFDLIISHSQQLDYLRSGLQVKINSFPIASLRLNDNTFNQTLFRLILPSNLIHVGRNSVEIIAGLNARDMCSPPDETIAWLRVSAESLLHLPLESAGVSLGMAKEFKDFPDSFLSGLNLDNTTFVLSSTDFESWKAAGALAYQLGNALPGSGLLQLGVIWTGEDESKGSDGNNVILVGKPNDFTNLSDKDQFPSLVFNPDNTLSEDSALAMVAKPISEKDVGYLAIRGYASDSGRILMAVLGNTPAGLNFAVDMISLSQLHENNFAVVVNEGVEAGWFDESISTGKVSQTVPPTTDTPIKVNNALQFRQRLLTWVIPLIAGLLIILIFLIIVEIRKNRRVN